MKSSRWWAAVWVALLLVFAPVVEAQAGGKRRAVPDLRQAAGRQASARRSKLVRLPLTVHIATESGDPVASKARIARWVRRANIEMAPYGIEVVVRSVRNLPHGWSRVTRWRERRQLAGYAPRDGSIHVFVIEELDTQRRRSFRRRIRGLHWRYRGLNPRLRSREYVVVTEGAPGTTFVHELGHLFGLRHSTAADNIMCSCRRGQDVGFSRDQGQIMRDGVTRYASRQGRSGPTVRADRRSRRR